MNGALRCNECWPLTVAGSEEVFQHRAVEIETGHCVALAVEVLDGAHGAHVQLADTIVTYVDVRQSLKPVKVSCLLDGQHEPVHSQVELLYAPHLGQRVGVQLLNLPYTQRSNLWRPLLSYVYSYKASCARPGWAVIFVIFDIRAIWRSGLIGRVPGCQKLQMTA